MDGVRKEQEEVVMKLTKLGRQQEQGHCASHTKFQSSSINRSRDIKDLKISCQHIPSHPLKSVSLIY